MESQNTAYCRTCRGTQWVAKGLCRDCEITLDQAKALVLERARLGHSTPDEALAAIEEFESRPSCFEPKSSPTLETALVVEQVQSRTLTITAAEREMERLQTERLRLNQKPWSHSRARRLEVIRSRLLRLDLDAAQARTGAAA